jgi:tRNA/rRNA methyltransferase
MTTSAISKTIDNITIVLVNPQTPDNIGLAARAMKNTGFKSLTLVNPNMQQKSIDVAKRARDFLEKATICTSLTEAVSDSTFVLGTTRRPREFRFSYSFEDIKAFMLARASVHKVSILFSREDFGLSAQETKLCDSLCYLPATQSFPSYNLSFSVGIVCYSLKVLLDTITFTQTFDPATKEDINELFRYLEKCLCDTLDERRVPSILDSLKRIALRTQLAKNEVALLKGLILKKSLKKTHH